MYTLLWRHNDHDSVSNHQPHDCLLNRLFRRRSKKTSKPRVTGLCVGTSPETGEFPAQMASNTENVSIWWRHHVMSINLATKHISTSQECENTALDIYWAFQYKISHPIKRYHDVSNTIEWTLVLSESSKICSRQNFKTIRSFNPSNSRLRCFVNNAHLYKIQTALAF